ncbi:pyridoxamine 5'-phosphate oxidase family protein [uncultured Bartonella sp.]|uniref:pyridoxamine 5'-phosphate oxidase family protein n=1 Tax=uncultured Bartonella sp. TaxID=104108 RepID=UPI00261C7E00|nr:pyridoxamine 5'-phosphate oxidase family protein [uncultured Bartonella sp.]
MSADDFPITDKNRVKRSYKRACYDKQTIYNILDSSALAHVAYVIDGEPFCTPTCYWRDGDMLYWHGSSASRMMKNLANGVSVCVTVSHLDGFVLARSGFHHSVNYRSAMCFGKAIEITSPDEKRRALETMVNRFYPDRTKELRPVTPQELKATSVIAMKIESAAAKCRSSAVGDDKEDYSVRIWAGIIPVKTTIGSFEPDQYLEENIKPAQPLLDIFKQGRQLDDALVKAQNIYEKQHKNAAGGSVDDSC